MDHDTPMERQLKVVSDIARLQQTVENTGSAWTTVSSAWEARWSASAARWNVIDRQLERNAIRDARVRAAMRWVGGVVSAVVVAALVMVLGLRR